MYCTLTDIMNRRIAEDDLIQLTDDQGQGVVDQTVVAEIINESDELINGYARSHYPVPFSPVPGLIRNISVELSVYALYQRRSHVETPEGVVRGYNKAREDLHRIQRREVLLDVVAPSQSGASIVGNDRRFTRDSMKGLL